MSNKLKPNELRTIVSDNIRRAPAVPPKTVDKKASMELAIATRRAMFKRASDNQAGK